MKDERIPQYVNFFNRALSSKRIREYMIDDRCFIKLSEKEIQIYAKIRRLQFEIRQDYGGEILKQLTRR